MANIKGDHIKGSNVRCFRSQRRCLNSLSLCAMRKSVFGTTFFIAMPSAAISSLLYHIFPGRDMSAVEGEAGILRETQVWGGFSFLLGFLIVFRTSQAYNRFWEGCTASYRMQTEWFDAASSVVSFTKYAVAKDTEVAQFKELLVRLLSMLHAAAFADLEAGEAHGDSEVVGNLWAHFYELIDPAAINSRSIQTIKSCNLRTELLFTWVQQLIVESISSGVLAIPAPILSRTFQEMANGMVAFHDAMRISYVPFPFPYAQACDCVLILHWLLCPLITSQWVTNSIWAGIFCFIQVFVLWTLNLTAMEIDRPFGKDPNDIDGEGMQIEFNNQLLMLLSPGCANTPKLSSKVVANSTATEEMVSKTRSGGSGEFFRVLSPCGVSKSFGSEYSIRPSTFNEVLSAADFGSPTNYFNQYEWKWGEIDAKDSAEAECYSEADGHNASLRAGESSDSVPKSHDVSTSCAGIFKGTPKQSPVSDSCRPQTPRSNLDAPRGMDHSETIRAVFQPPPLVPVSKPTLSGRSQNSSGLRRGTSTAAIVNSGMAHIPSKITPSQDLACPECGDSLVNVAKKSGISGKQIIPTCGMCQSLVESEVLVCKSCNGSFCRICLEATSTEASSGTAEGVYVGA